MVVERAEPIPVTDPAPETFMMADAEWENTEEPAAQTTAVHVEQKEIRNRFHSLSVIADSVSKETTAQVAETMASSGALLRDMSNVTASSLSRLWEFLTHPVTVPTRKATKTWKRSTLFFLDVFRFGGTFAAIFAVLFTALNAQSFWEIAKANVTPLLEPPSLELESAPLPSSPVAASTPETQGLLAYLPEVGPPINMVMIPKLRIIAPLVQPPTEALLRQDWPAVEKDIQESLLKGVVHYPGTAKPGQAGNFFLTGHSSNYGWIKSQFNSIFARLHQLSVGDEYWVYWNGDSHRYIVRSKKEVSPSDVTVLDQPPDQRIATLMTCSPVGTTLRRLIVQSQEVDPDSGEVLRVGEKTERAPTPLGMQMLSI